MAEATEICDIPVDVVGVGTEVHHSLAVALQELRLDALARHRLQQLELDASHLGDEPLDRHVRCVLAVDLPHECVS